MGFARRYAPVVVLAAVLALLAGCIDTSTDVTLGSDGSGSIELTYRIDRTAWDTGVFDDSNIARPIPVSREEFQKSVLELPGLKLRSYRKDETDTIVTVTARLSFADVKSLRDFLGADSLTIDQNADGHGSWRETISNGAQARSDAATALANDLSGYSIRLRLSAPLAISAASGTVGSDGKTVDFTATLAEVMGTKPIVWEASW